MHTSVHGRQVRSGLWRLHLPSSRSSDDVKCMPVLCGMHVHTYMLTVMHIKFLHKNNYTHVV